MAERIEIKSLSKNYKSHKVIKNMNVTFPGGKIIGMPDTERLSLYKTFPSQCK